MVAPYKLSTKTIGEIVDEAADKYGDKEALVFFSDNIRMSFRQFKEKVRHQFYSWISIEVPVKWPIQRFFGHTFFTCTTSGFGETVFYPVTPYENADGHLLDKIPWDYGFLMF